MKWVSEDWLTGTSAKAFVGIMLYMNYNNWWAAQDVDMEEETSALFSTFNF